MMFTRPACGDHLCVGTAEHCQPRGEWRPPPPPRRQHVKLRVTPRISSAFLFSQDYGCHPSSCKEDQCPCPPPPLSVPCNRTKEKSINEVLACASDGKELLVMINIVFVLQQSLFSWARSLCATLAFHLKPSVLKSNAWTNADSCMDPKVL